MTNGSDFQPFPCEEKFGLALDQTIETVVNRISLESSKVYYYVVAAVQTRDGLFVQTGCGPNFQGDCITLCTCKHLMRTGLDVDNWNGQWIAGFTSRKAGGGRNYLVYLMRVGQAFGSHMDLWLSPSIPVHVKQAKAARLHRFGDIFQPIEGKEDPFDPRSYHSPIESHCHFDPAKWHKDICYQGFSRRRAALLVGDAEHSLVWNHLRIYSHHQIGKGHKKNALTDFLAQLVDEGTT